MRVPGWDLPLQKAFMRAITPDKPTTADTTTLIDGVFGQVLRAIEGRAPGREPFTFLLRLLTTPFDRVNMGKGYTKLHNFGLSTGTPFCDLSRVVRVLVSAGTGNERVLAPGVDVVLELVRMAVNDQFPAFMPTLYPGFTATDPKPYASLDAMCKAFND